jgi:RecA/RadA recombinase
MTPNIEKVFGPPGSGKTTYLLNVVDNELASGVSSARIGYFSFTRKAANEARDRALVKFPHLHPKTDFPFFRTLHSLAYRTLAVKPDLIMQAEHYREFAAQAGIAIKISADDDTDLSQPDNPILNEINLARIRGVDLRQHYNESGLDIEWHHFEFVERTYRHFKRSKDLLDFTDLLEMIVQQPDCLPMLETVIIDEAQDLSRLQWQLVECLAKRSKKMYLAGDDDQCQPGHTKVLTTDGPVLMQDLDPQQHRLVCYDQRGAAVIGARSGFAFKKAQRPYTGKMYTVSTSSGLASSYTENHHCIVRWKPLQEVLPLRVVYLMEKKGKYRVGQCQLFRADGCVHAWVRAHSEEADRMWFLRVVDSQEEATYLENYFSYRYGIPQTVFLAAKDSRVFNQSTIDRIFNDVPTYAQARQLLQDIGLSFDYAIYDKNIIRKRRGGSQIFTTHAACLIPEAMRLGHAEGKSLVWENFTLSVQTQSGPVYSLEVEKHHNYFADGILTHNCVFTWAGADVKSFLSFTGTIKVLQQSYRVPSTVHRLANQVVHRIRERQPKVWKPRDFEGHVMTYYRFEDVPIDNGEWLILASTNYLLNPVGEWLKGKGVLFDRSGVPSVGPTILKAVVAWERLRKNQLVGGEEVANIYRYLDSDYVARGHRSFKGDRNELYAMEQLQASYGLLSTPIWHEALGKIANDKREYLISVLRRGGKLTDGSRVKLSTIHGAKGGEADNVLLLMDISTKFAKEYQKNGDNVNRLFYVGITRAKKSLHLVLPKFQDKGFML